jgi:surface antigen
MAGTHMVATSVAAFALLLALPIESSFGPGPAFAKGGDGDHGGGDHEGGDHGGGDHGAGDHGAGGHGAGGHEAGAGAGGAGAGGAGAGGAGAGGGTAGGSAAGGVAGASGGSSAGSSGAAGSGGGGGARDGAMAAFIASPVFGHVASTVPTTVTASPLFTSRIGLPCRTMTQTITISGQDVHASAVMCRQADGQWRIDPTRNPSLGRNQAATRVVPPGE